MILNKEFLFFSIENTQRGKNKLLRYLDVVKGKGHNHGMFMIFIMSFLLQNIHSNRHIIIIIIC